MTNSDTLCQYLHLLISLVIIYLIVGTIDAIDSVMVTAIVNSKIRLVTIIVTSSVSLAVIQAIQALAAKKHYRVLLRVK